MKKILSLLLILGLCVGLVGCGGGSSKTPEETLEAIKTYTNKILVDDLNWYDDYRDVEGNCYNHDGIKKTCGRIKGEIKDYYILKIMKENESLDMSIIVDGDISDITYYNDNASYTYSDNVKTVSFMEDDCKYILSGESDVIDEEDLCDSSRKEEAEKVKKAYEEMLSDIGITEKELKEFASWYAQNDGKKIIENLKEEKKNQKPITNDEIKDILSNKYDFTKLDDKSIYMEDSDLGYSELLFVPKQADHQDAMVFKSKFANDVTLYIYKNGDFVGADANECSYSINDKKIISKGDCSSSTVSDINLSKYYFDKILEENGITLDELFNFFINYK